MANPLSLTKREKELLDWLIEKTKEWDGSFLLEDPDHKTYRAKLAAAITLVEELKAS